MWPPAVAAIVLLIGCASVDGASKAPAHKHPPPPPPQQKLPQHTEEVVFVGCYADDKDHDLGELPWKDGLARGMMSVTQCAIACADSPYFAMQGGHCMCALQFATGPCLLYTSPSPRDS